ncbi:MAG: uroporphyrinogen decarboxylase [Chlamydiales bacterium]|nr:uroporphyrinogen decarboxylase [Chlamydiales bacterium]
MTSLFLNALSCCNDGRPPVWLMRQAGRYLPEYRALRARHDFLDMCHRPELIADVTLMPIKRFDMDAAILFSDILIVLEILGRKVRFEEGVGPVIDRPLANAIDVHELKIADISQLSFVAEGIARIKQQLRQPLIGFCGGPFTVASYLIEGGSSRELSKTKRWMFQDPDSFHQLLDIITQINIDYLKLQVAAGVDAIQVFDSWAQVLAPNHFEEFSLRYMDKIVKALEPTKKPIILFCRGSSVFAKQLASSQPSAISVDWNSDLAHQRKLLGPNIAIQGNLDPHLLFAPLHVIRREAEDLLSRMRGDKGFIFGLGHGVLPETPIEAVETLVNCVRTCMAKR